MAASFERLRHDFGGFLVASHDIRVGWITPPNKCSFVTASPEWPQILHESPASPTGVRRTDIPSAARFPATVLVELFHRTLEAFRREISTSDDRKRWCIFDNTASGAALEKGMK